MGQPFSPMGPSPQVSHLQLLASVVGRPFCPLFSLCVIA